MDLQLSCKTAIVTGASRGIGRANAMRLAQEGMRVTLVDRTGATLEELGRIIGSQPLPITADLRDPAAPAAVAMA